MYTNSFVIRCNKFRVALMGAQLVPKLVWSERSHEQTSEVQAYFLGLSPKSQVWLWILGSPKRNWATLLSSWRGSWRGGVSL